MGFAEMLSNLPNVSYYSEGQGRMNIGEYTWSFFLDYFGKKKIIIIMLCLRAALAE